MQSTANTVLLLALCLNLSGCMCVPHGDFPPGSIPMPVGTHVKKWQCAQRVQEDFDRMSLFLSDWKSDTAELSPAATNQLSRNMQRCMSIPSVQIETSGNSALDEERKQAVMQHLADNGFDVYGVPDAVVVGDDGLGLRNAEIQKIQQKLLSGNRPPSGVPQAAASFPLGGSSFGQQSGLLGPSIGF